MIVYKEFSSLVEDLGFSERTLYSVSNSISKHYKPLSIPKSNGESRQLHVPGALLKTIQRRICDKLLSLEPVSPYATAYRPGGSTLLNAQTHIGKALILKLDIRHFFDHLIYPIVKEKAFPAKKYSEQNRILLAILCTYQDALPQGAPTSPAISNIIMREFDNAVGRWCENKGISYSRYCDDMTFSGDFDPKAVVGKVTAELRKLGLFLNERKTVVVRTGQRMSVTGIVVNEKLSISADYKKRIRQEMHYCMKYGIESHMEKAGISKSLASYTAELLGRINYVLSVEADNPQMREYQKWLKRHS